MKVIVLDFQELLDQNQHSFIGRKLRLSLARFDLQFSCGTVDLSQDDSLDAPFSCTLTVDVEGLGGIQTTGRANSISFALLRAMEIMQLQIANRLHWRTQSASFWTWSLPISKRLDWRLALNQASPFC